MITVEEAQDIYRTAWNNYLLTSDEDRKKIISQVMNTFQEHCVSNGGPGPEWEAFVDTLPGFWEHWVAFKNRAYGIVEEIETKNK